MPEKLHIDDLDAEALAHLDTWLTSGEAPYQVIHDSIAHMLMAVEEDRVRAPDVCLGALVEAMDKLPPGVSFRLYGNGCWQLVAENPEKVLDYGLLSENGTDPLFAAINNQTMQPRDALAWLKNNGTLYDSYYYRKCIAVLERAVEENPDA